MNLTFARRWLFLLLTLFSYFSLFAQQRTVSGVVSNVEGKVPVEGVTVSVKGTDRSTTSNAKGEFSIAVSGNESVLKFTSVGFTYQEMKVGSNSNLTVSLSKDTKQLDDVVVIGYGTQKLKDVTGSIVSIDPRKLEDQPVATITEALRGQVPGLNVTGGSTRPGANPSLSIRQQFNWGKDGGGTIPLIIIDDVIQIDPQSGLPSLERFNLLDITEVESITVLRDASAAIYGSRASQGAIVVKTKRGKIGPPKIRYTGKFEINDAVSHGKVMDANQYGVFANRFGRSAGWNNNSFFSTSELERMKSLNYDWSEDWKAAGAMQHSLEVSGGADRATFFVGGSYYRQGANLGTQDFNKYSFRAGADVKVANNLKFNATIAANNSFVEKSFTKVNVSDGSYALGGEQNDYSMLLHMPKYIPWKYNIAGQDQFISPALGPNKVAGSPSGNGSLANTNYYALLDNGSKTTGKLFGYNANFSLQYDVPFIKGLSARVNYAITSYSENTEQILMPVTLSLANNTNTEEHHLYDSAKWNAPVLNRSQSRVTYDNKTGTSEQINFFLTYDHSFGDHNVSAVVSGEQAKNGWEDRYQIYENPIPGAYNGTSVSAGTLNAGNTLTSRNESASLSYLGRVSYSYRSKYLAQFLFREDASTRFAPENYWGFFPSVSVGWVLSEENFFKDGISWINQLKIRGSVGKTGNDNVKAWKWVQLYRAETDKGMGFGTNGGGLTTGITPETSPNRDIRWDRTIQRNIGIDISLLRSRLSMSIDQYYNTSTDMLTDMSGTLGVPFSIGGAFAEENYGGIKAWGTEISATWRDRVGKVDYSIGMNFGISNNEITRYIDQPFDYESVMTTRRQEGQSTFAPAWGFRTWKQTSSGDGMLRTDADIDNYWAYLTDHATKSGVTGAVPTYLGITNKALMKKGMLAYEDVAGALDGTKQVVAGPNGQIVSSQDYVQLLNKNKNRAYGITTNLSATFKGVTIQAQIATSWGGLRTIDYIKQGTSSTHSMWAHPVYLTDMFDSTDNPNGKYPNLALYDAFGGTNSDFFSIPSFRMFVRSLSVGYALPKDLVRKAHFESARFFLSGQNLWDFYNPYPNKYRNMYDAPNVGYPTLRTWALGVNLGF